MSITVLEIWVINVVGHDLLGIAKASTQRMIAGNIPSPLPDYPPASIPVSGDVVIKISSPKRQCQPTYEQYNDHGTRQW